MTTWKGYFGVENLNLDAAQKQTLVAELQRLGPSAHRSPACLCHWRTRLDGEAVIFEALFNENNLTAAKFKERLADIFGVAPGTIDTSTQQVTFVTRPSPVVTFSRNATDYLRMVLFGGTGATWEESGVEARGYLIANQENWEEGLS